MAARCQGPRLLLSYCFIMPRRWPSLVWSRWLTEATSRQERGGACPFPRSCTQCLHSLTQSLAHIPATLGNVVFILGNQLKQILLKKRKRIDIGEQQVVSPTYSWKIKHLRRGVGGPGRNHYLIQKNDIWLKVSKPPSKAVPSGFLYRASLGLEGKRCSLSHKPASSEDSGPWCVRWP